MIAFLAMAALAGQAQSGLTLQKYLTDNPWDAGKRGAVLVVDPGSVRATGDQGGLESMHRQEMPVGTITAIAPTEMVFINTGLEEPPNLYDGLPRKDKVVYLASTLDANQWRIASSTGIGLGDLRTDQQAVYRSILPSEFSFSNHVLQQNNSLSNVPGEPEQITLTHDEEAEVRLHFYREIFLGVWVGPRGTSMIPNQLWDEMNVGQHVLSRIDSATEDRTSLYGVKVREILPNEAKPSDLNYRAHNLDAPLALGSEATIGDLCKAASAATHLNIVPDIRVGGMSIQTAGASARSGDVLKAMALCVTGTYRRVGSIFVLTSDLEGMGAKRLKLSLWSWDLDQQTYMRSQEWNQKIATNGGIRSTGYPADSPLKPNDAMRKFMEGDDPGQGNKSMPASDLPPVWQRMLLGGQGHYGPDSPLHTDKAEPYDTVLWNFVLPDGRQLTNEGEVGQLNSLTVAGTATRDYSSKSTVKPISFATTASPALVYETEDPAVAAKLPAMAKAHGFHEVWIRTWSPECIAKAVEGAKKPDILVRLVIAPWEIPPGTSSNDLDRSMMGTSMPQSQAILESTAWSKADGPNLGLAPLRTDDILGPFDPTIATSWDKLVKLAQTPGVDGCVLVETEPPGYEPDEVNAQYLPVEMTSCADMGYNGELRSRFLAENQVDPVDICDSRLSIGLKRLDLSLPFFGTVYGFGSIDSSAPEGKISRWMKFCTVSNAQAVQVFANRVPGEVLFEARRTVRDMPRRGRSLLVPWRVSQDLPVTAEVPFDYDRPIPADDYWLLSFGWPLEPKAASRMYDNLTGHLKKASGKVAIDLSSAPPEQLSKLLDTWFQASSK